MKRRIYLILAAVMLAFFATTINVLAADKRDVNTMGEFAKRFLANYATISYNLGTGGFPSNEVYSPLQTRDGFMWFGGDLGLIRYDSKQYKVWGVMSPNESNFSYVCSLHEDRNGTLWIGMNGMGLASRKNGDFTKYDKSMGLPSNSILDIAEASDGKIYFGTPDGLFYLDSEGNFKIIALGTAVHPSVISVSCDAQNNVYAVLNSGELFVYANDGKTARYPANTDIMAAECVSGNRLIAGAQDGSVIITGFNGKTFTHQSVKRTPLTNISAIYEDSRGHIWIASETGIGFLDKNENYHNIGNPNGVGFYTGICEDYQNGYWFTSSKGVVVHMALSKFSSLNTLFNIETGSTNAILMDNGKTYIGTDKGLLILDENGRLAPTSFSRRINSQVRGIFHDSGGHIWICTFNGVIRYAPERHDYKIWRSEDGLVSERTRCMTELPNGVVAVGTSEGVSFIKGNAVVTLGEAFGANKPIELPRIRVLSLVCSADGTLYIGTDGSGVFALNKDGVIRYGEEDGLTSDVIHRMLVNEKTKGIWVATYSGLCYIDEGKKLRAIHKVPSYTIHDVMRYNNELVLLTKYAIIRMDADALLSPDLPLEYSTDKNSALATSINANAWNLITKNGVLYFCCEDGISTYSFETGSAPFIPYAGIAKIDVDGAEHTDFSKKIVIPRNAHRLTIDMSYLSFGFLDEAKLYYMLSGVDKKAQLLAKDSALDFHVSYTNLKGGDYTLRIWTEDYAGNRGNAIEVGFHKKLKWFEHTLVQIIFAILAVLLIYATFRYKGRKLLEKQREYRAIISQALSAIANAIDVKDSYTNGHSVRTAAYSVEIARRMGMEKDFIENIYYIGLLHDVGKIGIPNNIINKPEKLTDEEYGIIKQHSKFGQEILNDITIIPNLAAGAREHHERWDGNGYPQGISGEDISLVGRIISIADAYDAMSHDRSYRKGLPKEVIVEEFKRCKDKQFDPQITDIVIDMIEHDYFSTIDVNKIIGISN